MTFRCICVDDEPMARKGIALSLKPYPDFELVAQFGSADELLANMPENIDVLFVDIQMPRTNGFELLQQWPGPLPIVVFVTAFDQYAVKAFEQQALDYLLKPIDEDRFAQVITRIRESLAGQDKTVKTDQLMQTIANLKQKLQNKGAALSVKTDEGYFRIHMNELLYIEGVGDHVCLHLADRQLLSRDTLKKYVAQLSEHGFYQIHKSFLVNREHVKQVAKLRFGDHQIVLSDNRQLRLSRRYKSAIEHFVG